MTLRHATMDDADLLLEWANDPDVRAASFNSNQISTDIHKQWLRDRLLDWRCAFYIAEWEGNPVGYARVEMTDYRVADLAVSVDAPYRQRGLGRRLIAAAAAQAATELDLGEIRARVKAENEASVRAFVAAGFRRTGPDTLSWMVPDAA